MLTDPESGAGSGQVSHRPTLVRVRRLPCLRKARSRVRSRTTTGRGSNRLDHERHRHRDGADRNRPSRRASAPGAQFIVVANAAAHRDYARPTAIVVEADPPASPFAAQEPCRLPVTVATLREAQSARNHTVIDILRRFGLAEDSGQGIDVIQDGMIRLLDEPGFREGTDTFEVTSPCGHGHCHRARMACRT